MSVASMPAQGLLEGAGQRLVIRGNSEGACQKIMSGTVALRENRLKVSVTGTVILEV